MKKLSIITSLLIAFILIAGYAYASISANIVATASKTSLKKGEEFTVSVYLDNLNYSNNGIDEVELNININKDILNDLTVNNIVTQNGSVTIGNNTLKVEDVLTAKEDQVVFSNLTTDCDYKIFIDMKNPITTSRTKLLDIKFKIKDSISESYINKNIDNAITISGELTNQVTVQDLNNGITADTGKAIMANVPVLITNETVNNNSNNSTNDNNTANQQDNQTNDNTTTNQQTNQTNDKTTPDNSNTNNGNAGQSTNDNKTTNNRTNDKTSSSTIENNRENTNVNQKKDTNDSTTRSTIDNNKTINDNSNQGTKDNLSGNTNGGIVGSTNGNSDGGLSTGGTSGVASTVPTNYGAGSAPNATTANKILPAAGMKLFILPVIAIGGIVVYSYKKYSEYKMIK